MPVSFDPAKPFEVLNEPSNTAASAFDPTKPFEVVKPSTWSDSAEYVAKAGESGVKGMFGQGLGLAAGIYNSLFGLSDDEAAQLGKTAEGTADIKRARDASPFSAPGTAAERGSESLIKSQNDTMASLSAGAKQFDDKTYLTLNRDKAAYLSPTKMTGDILNSLPSTLVLALSARFGGTAATEARAAALAKGLGEEAANKAAVEAATKIIIRAGAAGEGSLGYEQQYEQTRKQVLDMPEDKLAKSPEYQDLLKQGYDADKARQVLAGRAGNMAGFTAGVVDAATNIGSGKVLGHVIGEGGNLLARTGKAFAAESIEEGVQSAGEQFGGNYAIKQTADPTQDLSEGVAENAAQGAVVGGLTGAGVGVAAGEHGIGGRESPAPVDPTNPVPAPASPVPGGANAAPPVAGNTAPAIETALPAEAVTPQQKVSVDQVLDASDVETAISAAAEAAVASPTGAPRASLDQIIDETKKSLDTDLPNTQQEKLEKLFGGFNTGTVEKTESGDMEYRTSQGARFPLQIWEPDPKNPDAGGISPELAAAQIAHYKDVGVDVVYIRDDKNIPFDGVVDASQPNTIFLSSNPTRNAAQVGQHEVTHVFENTMLPDGTSLADIMQQQISEGITNEGIEHAANLFGDTAPDRTSYPNTPEGQAAHADAVLVHLFNELGADIGGEAPKFEGFIQKVMDAVETRYGGGVASQTFQKFMNGIREAITTLRKFFKGETQSQKWVNNLEKVHTTLAQMYAAKYGEVAKLQDPITPENVITEALVNKEANPARAGPAPREGYEKAKKQAEVYKRWLGELDEIRRTNAQKSPEVGMLRAEEKTIIGKVKDERYLTKTARGRLDRVRAEIEARVNPKEDNNDMALVRAKMVEAHGRMADAASVSKKQSLKTEEPEKEEKPKREHDAKITPATIANEHEAEVTALIGDAIKGAKFSPKVEEKSPVFFSALERAVDSVKFDKAPPGQWMATIKNMPGIKADEIKATGIEKWLNAQTGPVAKTDVLGQLELGSIKIEEVIKGAAGYSLEEKAAQKINERMIEKYGSLSNAFTHWTAEEEKEFDRVHADAVEETKKHENAGETKFHEHSLPGGENYRELLMTLPGWKEKFDKYNAAIQEAAAAHGRADRPTGYMNYATPEEIEHLQRLQPDENIQDYRSSHWVEPNVLAHIRFDTRTGPNGEKILHIAEIQSDWHQQGRRHGYADEKPEHIPYVEPKQIVIKEDEHIWTGTTPDGRFNGMVGKGVVSDEADARSYLANYINKNKIQTANRDNIARANRGVPNAPFKTTWHELAMKRAMRYAAENGYDRISWDTGATNADRYDLSKSVRKIQWTKIQHSDKVFLEIYDRDQEKVVDKSYDVEKLPDIVGKDIADQIISKMQAGKASGTIEGENLKVGGEGMRGFYDKILPSFVDKYVKKWGTKVEGSSINAGDRMEYVTVRSGRGWNVEDSQGRIIDHGFESEEAADVATDRHNAEDEGGQQPVHSVAITPQMRAAVMQGQPKFSPKAKPTVKAPTKEMPSSVEAIDKLIANRPQVETKTFKTWFGESKVAGDDGKPLVVYHGTTMDFDSFNRENANSESDFGAGFYFSNERDDTANNYAGLGPDLTNKIEREAERIASETDRNYKDADVRKEARAKFVNNEGTTLPVYLKIETPFELGGEKETFLDFNSGFDSETEEYGEESGKLVDFIMGLRNEESNFYDTDLYGVINSLIETAIDYEGLPASRLDGIIRGSESFGHTTDEQGNLAAHELYRRALEQAGFDGVIDRSVNKKFGSERGKGKGKIMAGMNENTVHFIVFEPIQIKSAVGNSGGFSASDPSILRSPRVPSQLREKLIRKDPAYRAMFDNNLPTKHLAIPTLTDALAKTEIKPGDDAVRPVVAPIAEEEKPPRRKSLRPIEGAGREETRAINGALYNVGEEQPQMDRAARLVAEDSDRALAIAMREVNSPAGMHPEFVFMALEEAAQISGDVALQEQLSRSRIAEEATTMGQRIAAWRNRAEIAPVEDMRRIREAREARAKVRGVDPAAQIDKVVQQAREFVRKAAKSTKRPNWNDFITAITCRT